LSAAFCLPADPTRAERPERGEERRPRRPSLKFIYERWIVRGPRISPGQRGRRYNRCLKIRPDKGDQAPYARLRRLEEAPYAHVPIEHRSACRCRKVKCFVQGNEANAKPVSSCSVVTRSASDLPQWSSRQTITTSISRRRGALSNASRSGRCFAPLPTWVYPYFDTPTTHKTINTY
jgi:hypothetical protein